MLVTGCGPIGLMGIAVLKSAAERVFAAEVSGYRLKFAERMGLTCDKPVKGGRGTNRDGGGGRQSVDVVLEMSGAGGPLKTGLGAVTPGGRVSIPQSWECTLRWCRLRSTRASRWRT
nr:hypothetical protein [Candidatus Bathyarchaeota archaeon]